MSESTDYSGKFLEINLTDSSFKEFRVSKDILKLYLGGKGLGLNLLKDRINKETDPMGEENILALMMGAYMGTNAPNSGRFDAVTKSPLTGIMVSSSCGGPFGMALKTAGYCGLLISGKSKKPVYISIKKNNEIEFIDAAHLWGLDTHETQEKLKVKNAGILTIGQAGENKVLYANAISGHRFLGRGGIGAVMGSKNLKALIAHGKSVEIEIKNPEQFKKTKKKALKFINKNYFTSDLYRKFGTNSHVMLSNKNNLLPVKNFQFSESKEAYKISGEYIDKEFGQKPSVCIPCSIVCGHKSKFNEEKPIQVAEYETTGLLGSNLEIYDAHQIAKWNDMAGKYGMDTISLGTILSYATEATEKKIMETELKFGQAAPVTKMIEDIAFRRGIGDEFANGVKWLSEKYGGKDFAVHVKGMELSAYDPRGSWGQGLAYAVANRGACHLSATMFTLEPYLGLLNPYKVKTKAKFVNFLESLNSAINSTHVCQFTSYAYLLEPDIVKLTPKPLLKLTMQYLPDVALALMDLSIFSNTWQAVTGIKISPSEYLKAGERIHLLERYMNTKMGISSKDDTLPDRLLKEPRPEDKKKRLIPLQKLLKDYYKVKGYDADGIPTEKKLRAMKIIN